MKMLVYWGHDDQADLQIPLEVKWEDGTAATLNDYYKNHSATQTSFGTDKGLVTIVSPDIIATAKYDVANGHWALHAPGGDPVNLEERDPEASERTLMDEISSYPVAYKTIHVLDVLPFSGLRHIPVIGIYRKRAALKLPVSGCRCRARVC